MRLEAEAQRNEMVIAATGTLAAIAHAFAPKTKPMERFRRSLQAGQGDDPSALDGPAMAEIRRRLAPYVQERRVALVRDEEAAP